MGQLIEGFLVLWTFGGTVMDGVNLFHAVMDRREVLRRQINEGRKFLLMDEIRRAALRLISQLMLFIIMVIFFMMPNGQPAPRLVRATLLMVFLVVPATQGIQAFLDFRARDKLRRQYAAGKDHRRGQDRRSGDERRRIIISPHE